MIYAVTTVVGIGIVLFVLSFFLNDKIADIEGQIDQMQIKSMQETYQMQKKIKILEEELLTDPTNDELLNNHK